MERSERAVRIMPLGDSLTDGYTYFPGSYRVELWRRLTADGHRVDFVGSLANGPAGRGPRAHEGHSGWRIHQLHAHIEAWLCRSDPRTVMLLIGTNDIRENDDLPHAPARLSALIDRIRAVKPQCELFVATVPPQSDPVFAEGIRAYNAALAKVVAQKGQHVHLVPVHEALTTADLADGVHLTEDGYSKVAAVWYNALHAVPEALVPLSAGIGK
ncbi:SGNH/GDSL hydrolase family protein [Streptomyces smyrnaeus]|uniref:SGNH/GDSL hydrolase family protein n=1 Tax=Streptomyces smyrnaeus TaxID=1387713 RepID=UPI00367B471F